MLAFGGGLCSLSASSWLLFQVSRLSRIRQVKAASCNAFMNSKKLAGLYQMTATETEETGHVVPTDVITEDLFQMQHHHLLTCLEHTTVSLTFCFAFRPGNGSPLHGRRPGCQKFVLEGHS